MKSQPRSVICVVYQSLCVILFSSQEEAAEDSDLPVPRPRMKKRQSGPLPEDSLSPAGQEELSDVPAVVPRRSKKKLIADPVDLQGIGSAEATAKSQEVFSFI